MTRSREVWCTLSRTQPRFDTIVVRKVLRSVLPCQKCVLCTCGNLVKQCHLFVCSDVNFNSLVTEIIAACRSGRSRAFDLVKIARGFPTLSRVSYIKRGLRLRHITRVFFGCGVIFVIIVRIVVVVIVVVIQWDNDRY